MLLPQSRFFTMRMIKTVILFVILSAINYFALNSIIAPFISFIDSLLLFVFATAFAKIIETIQHYYHSSQLYNGTNIGQAILFALIAYMLFHIILTNVFSESTLYSQLLDKIGFVRFLILSLSYLILLSFYWVDQQKIQVDRLNKFALSVERENTRIELNNLQQQFKPHFLFNCLNSINALTLSNPEEARRMIVLLSQYLRNSIQTDNNEFRSLKEEIAYLKLYIEIEKVRFGERLTVNFDIPKDIEQIELPRLILQPIMENAIKYGLYDTIDPIEINIHITESIYDIKISIENPFDPTTVSANKGTGFGLESIRKKMEFLYGSSSLLRTVENKTTFITLLTIPKRNA